MTNLRVVASNAEDVSDELPRSYRIRWTEERKEAVVKAVELGAITFPQACARYRLSQSEFETWQQMATSGDFGSGSRICGGA